MGKGQSDEAVADAPAVDPAKAAIELIKSRMPEVYASVKRKAAEIGNVAFELVRRGARGEPGCFYAVERGVAVGTPWPVEVPTDVAALVARYGAPVLVMWGGQPGGQAHGSD